MLDSPEGVCPGQAPFEYPATSVRFSSTGWRLMLMSFRARSRQIDRLISGRSVEVVPRFVDLEVAVPGLRLSSR
jgi:hypothetical protein